MQLEWNAAKNRANLEKHGVEFQIAQYAFLDPKRVIARDEAHGQNEDTYFCFGKVDDGIITVRFTVRADTIRIFGAGFWRKGRKIYEKQNQIHE